MRSKFLLFPLLLLIVSCAYKGQTLETYIDNPGTIIKDPHFSEYQAKLDGVESDYLNKKITYSEYLEKKQALDDQYSKEVQKRDEIISPE